MLMGTMKAAVLREFGSPLSFEEVQEPTLRSGEVIVNVLAAPVVNYADEVFSGQRPFLLELPAIPGPGAIGRIREVSSDATRLRVGQVVYCDPTIRSRDSAADPDIILHGWTAGGPAALPLQRHFKDGAFAERMLAPTENVTVLGDVDPGDAGRWCALGTLLVPFGGFLAADLRAGQSVIVNGASGHFGSAGVAVALGMGASRVVGTARNTAVLEDLNRRFDDRFRPVTMTGDEATDTAAILDTNGGPADLVLDILPPAASSAQVRAAVKAVRPDGRVELMGGVRDALNLPYMWVMRNNITIHGQWMYPRSAPARLISMIRAGQISLDGFDITEFNLEAVNDAVAHAAAHAGPFATTVLRPDGIARSNRAGR
jgi:alcohol dehydrogenase